MMYLCTYTVLILSLVVQFYDVFMYIYSADIFKTFNILPLCTFFLLDLLVN